MSIKVFTLISVLNYDSLTQRIIFADVVNVTGDSILQKFILKQVFFLLTYYVPDVLIIYMYISIYMCACACVCVCEVCMALIILLSLLFYIENSSKRLFLVEIVFLLVREGLIS